MASFAALPVELVREVVQYLPIRSLLSFGLTSKYCHVLQVSSFSTLHLGVFHSKMASLTSALDVPIGTRDTHNINVILARRKSPSAHAFVRNQNAVIRAAIIKYRRTLRDLGVTLWDLDARTAAAIAKVRNLRHFSLKLDSSHTRSSRLGRTFEGTAPASTVWNLLCAKHNPDGALGRLRSLDLKRAGITDYQLLQILDSNAEVTNLRLEECLNITNVFFNGLTRIRVGTRLRTLHFTKSKVVCINDDILRYFESLPCLRVSLH